MTNNRAYEFKNRFDKLHGAGKWDQFCQIVLRIPRPRPSDVQREFPAASGKPMSRPTYYKWEARAQEVGKR